MSAMSNPTGPVLDYASPRPRGKIRLPSRSRIEARQERNEVVVLEWLEAKGRALFAIGLATITLLILPATLLVEIWSWRRSLHAGDLIFEIGAVGVVWSIEIVVLLMVINNTWRRTILEGRRDGLLLMFSSPFAQRRYEWGASEIEDLRLVTTTKPTDRNVLGELQVHVAAQPVATLFTDHAMAELTPIVSALRQAIGLRE
jgi:hypothetical protein